METEELQRLVDGSPVHGALGLRVRPAKEGVLFDAAPGRQHSTDGGEIVHGGVVATMLDTAATFALVDATGADWSTIDLRVDYLRPAPVAPLEVRGLPVQVGRRFGRAKAELADPRSGRLLAAAVGTFVRNG
ncbi:MAG TPA: PaaI family thioesterase [Acidimicrobiales bacterium]|nr:PaaI family thioesterase [Acidimicrobiales bacterium]